jgi:outer membrane murein-binding lipoprotein Lpp
MKRILFVLSAAVLLAGCYKDDIDNLKKDMNDLKERMAQYESLLDALNKRLYVTAYEATGGYYLITLSDGTTLSVRNTSSFIEIGENGNWWVDGRDSGHPAKGEAGAAPRIEIGGNGNWWIGGEDTGASAKGQAGKAASEIVSIALVDGTMTFVFADGRTISIEMETDAAAPQITLTEPVGGFVTDKMKWLRITPQVSNENGAICTWLLNEVEIAGTKDLHHVFAEAGSYELQFKAKNGVGETSKTITVTVNNKTYENKITRVFEYLPAPGQFINTMPAATAGDTPEIMRQKAEDALTDGGMICLGGFGGYVVFGFDHTVINREGNDFLVRGNAYANNAEPGVIVVSLDANGNGLPDDEWYEIAGSEYHKSTTVRDYEITYHKPASEPENPSEPEYIRWTDNRGQSGYLAKNSFHRQTYYPLWLGDSYTLKGTFMESGMYDQSGNGSLWVNPACDWGYADNRANADARAQIDISWAVDGAGNPVALKGIDFVRVHTGQRAQGGWTGEVSTELSGFTDLNL